MARKKAIRISKKMWREIEAKIAASAEQETPLPGGLCREKDCDGVVVKKVIGTFHGKFLFDTPKCCKCGRTYRFAFEMAREVGAKEFLHSLTIPCTI